MCFRRLVMALGILMVTPPPVLPGETLPIPPCGFDATQTQGAYSGIVNLTVTGNIIVTPGNPRHDGFYGLAANDPSVKIGDCPECFRFSRESQGTCTCSLECAGNNQPVSSVLVGPYPSFEPGNTYTVQLDLGAGPPEKLAFGIADCGCWDNSGQLTVTIEAMPLDDDGDGVPDNAEPIVCLGTIQPATVNALGCSPEQICPCTRPWGRLRWKGHGEYVRCVIGAAKEFQELGIMSKQDRQAAVKAARRTSCGRPGAPL